MKTFRFHFNTQYAADLREAINDRRKQSIDNEHIEKQINGSYCAWDRTCAAMDRLEDTLHYLNSIELGRNENSRSAFDFYDFINNAYIVIDCIKTIGNIFGIDSNLIVKIEDSTSVFGKRLSEESTDQKYFEYIRSLCSVHPLNTNRQKIFLNRGQFHCCPFVTWKRGLKNNDADLTALIYTSTRGGSTLYHGMYVSQFEQYLIKWIDFIPKIIDAKNDYADKKYENLRSEPVKSLSEFEDNVVKYLSYLKSEYCRRFDYGNDYQFDIYANFFTVKLSDSRNKDALKKYQNAIIYSLGFMKNELQNMSCIGFENTGLKYPQKDIETTLFDELYCIPTYNSPFDEFSYSLGKIYYLEFGDNYSEYDKIYARNLLKEPKKLINRYVYFTNSEPDIERAVLVKLALYLEAFTRKNLLNKNIPNTQEYRMQILSDEKYKSLFIEEKINEKPINTIEDLQALLKKYGG